MRRMIVSISMSAHGRVALATFVAGTMFLSQTSLQSYFAGSGPSIKADSMSALTPAAFGEAAVAAQTSGGAGAAVGRGCTTVYFIDEDCDGYGPGVRSSGTYGWDQLGVGDKPDADDKVAGINTYGSVVSAYGSGGTLSNVQLKTFLASRGYTAVDNVFYVSTTGNDATGQADNPSLPFATYNGVHGKLGPGDAILYRAGTYDNPAIGGGFPVLASGTAGKPIIVMSMPGENVKFTTAGQGVFSTTNQYGTQAAAWVVIDGFTVDNSGTLGLGNGWNCSGAQNSIFRNIETQRFNYVTCINGHDNTTIERSIFHHQQEHGFYAGSNSLESDNMVIQDNIFYANGYSYSTLKLSYGYGGHQWNGRCNNCTWRRNMSHSNAAWGFSFPQGVHNSTIQNNLIFNNGTLGIILFTYDGDCTITGRPAGAASQLICPYDSNNNLFVNNTIWIGSNRADGNYGLGDYPEGHSAFNFVRATQTCVEGGASVAPVNCTMEQTFRNNLIIVTTGSAWRWRINLGSDAWDTNSTFENNIVYKLSSTTNVLTRESCDIVSGCAGGAVTNYAFPQFQSTYKATNNANTNPLVVRANPTEYGSAGLFDFRLQPGSPARDFGTTAGAPADDLTKAPRILPPDAGAYEYGGSTMSPPQAPTNLRIVR